MFNLLKSDLYKLKHSKELKICLLLLLILGIITIYFGGSNSARESLLNESTDMFALMACTLFSGMSLAAEFTKKTIYHPITSGSQRLSVLMSKYITYLITCLIFYITAYFIMGGLYAAFYGWGAPLTQSELSFILTYSLLDIFFGLCIASIPFFIAMQLKDTGISIAVSAVVMGLIFTTSQMFWQTAARYIADTNDLFGTHSLQMITFMLSIPVLLLAICSFLFTRQDIK
ncbi:MAG: ABC transporter permease [Turicibacter sp.]